MPEDEHEALHQFERLEHGLLIEVELGELRGLDLHQAQHGGRLVALQEGVHAEAALALRHAIKGIVHLAITHPALAETGRQGRVDEGVQLFDGQRRHLGLDQLAGDSHQGRTTGLEMHIARGVLDGEGQEVLEDLG